MNKRSAVAVAGGVAGALVSGLAGYSIKMQHPPAPPSAAAGKPIVKTQTKTVTIHKEPKVSAGAIAPVQTIVVRRPPTVLPVPRGAPPPVHHTGASRTGGGEQENEHEGGGGGGHDD
jgi:hypothetical protein